VFDGTVVESPGNSYNRPYDGSGPDVIGFVGES